MNPRGTTTLRCAWWTVPVTLLCTAASRVALWRRPEIDTTERCCTDTRLTVVVVSVPCYRPNVCEQALHGITAPNRAVYDKYDRAAYCHLYEQVYGPYFLQWLITDPSTVQYCTVLALLCKVVEHVGVHGIILADG